mgnify:CR=1 FL=1
MATVEYNGSVCFRFELIDGKFCWKMGVVFALLLKLFWQMPANSLKCPSNWFFYLNWFFRLHKIRAECWLWSVFEIRIEQSWSISFSNHKFFKVKIKIWNPLKRVLNGLELIWNTVLLLGPYYALETVYMAIKWHSCKFLEVYSGELTFFYPKLVQKWKEFLLQSSFSDTNRSGLFYPKKNGTNLGF